jgi:hypothetical protein
VCIDYADSNKLKMAIAMYDASEPDSSVDVKCAAAELRILEK